MVRVLPITVRTIVAPITQIITAAMDIPMTTRGQPMAPVADQPLGVTDQDTPPVIAVDPSLGVGDKSELYCSSAAWAVRICSSTGLSEGSRFSMRSSFNLAKDFLASILAPGVGALATAALAAMN